MSFLTHHEFFLLLRGVHPSRIFLSEKKKKKKRKKKENVGRSGVKKKRKKKEKERTCRHGRRRSLRWCISHLPLRFILITHTSAMRSLLSVPALALVFGAVSRTEASCFPADAAAKSASFCSGRISTGYGVWQFKAIATQDSETKALFEGAALQGMSADCLAYAKDTICSGAFIPCVKADIIPNLLCDHVHSARHLVRQGHLRGPGLQPDQEPVQARLDQLPAQGLEAARRRIRDRDACGLRGRDADPTSPSNSSKNSTASAVGVNEKKICPRAGNKILSIAMPTRLNTNPTQDR
jgi:hypothetical protein